MKPIKSKYLKLNLFDICKGLIVAIGAAVFNCISEQFMAESQNWKHCLMVGLSAIAAYLGKQLFTNSHGDLGREQC